MFGRRRLLWGWWVLVLVGFGACSVVALIPVGSEPGPTVVRVVGSDGDLWAYTQERTLLQGVESAWWVSHDGGMTWSDGDPSLGVLDSAPEEDACSSAACYRLVQGVRIERRVPDTSTWRLEHERSPANPPPANDEHRRDWEEERSLAVAEGPGFDAAAVAAGKEGALVRNADGTWQSVSVGRSWFSGIRWWLLGLGGAAALIGGLAVDQIIRHTRPARPVGSIAR